MSKFQHRHKRIITILFFAFFIFYVLLNIPYLLFISQNYDLVAKLSPFGYNSVFPLNIFNFDPSILVSGNMNTNHPLLNFISVPLVSVSELLANDSMFVQNLFFLILQSILNSLNVVLIYYYLSKCGASSLIAILFSILFGLCSYSIFSSFVPDSYTYAQFIIILSLVLFQYQRESKVSILPYAFIGSLNFGITSTNLLTFTGSFLINNISHNFKEFLKKSMKYFIILFSFILVFTAIQYILFSKTWVHNWVQSIQSSGLNYVESFSLSKHGEAFYLLISNPILTPNISIIDYNLMSFVSDASSNAPIYVLVISIFITIIAFLGFIKGLKTRDSWILATYIIFAFVLHIIVGFGLDAIAYDMYLYAGHYLFAIILLAALFFIRLKNNLVKRLLMSIMGIFIIIIFVNNLYQHHEVYSDIKSYYDEIEKTETKLDSSIYWEFFGNENNFTIVRAKLDLIDKPYVIFNGHKKIENGNADSFETYDLSDIYANGYLYISISKSDSNWGEDYVPTSKEIGEYFENNEYVFFHKESFNISKLNLSETKKIRLNSTQEWEFFVNANEYKVVRLNLSVNEIPYFLYKGNEKLIDANADFFNTYDLSDIYNNGFLYISISNNDSKWDKDYIPSKEEIGEYFDIMEYYLYIDEKNYKEVKNFIDSQAD